MKPIALLVTGIAMLLPLTARAIDSFYCPTNHAYINLGMTESAVTSACGQPTQIVQSKKPPTIRIPVTQLIYTTLNQGAIYEGLDSTYQMWSLASGSKGVTLQVNIQDNKVTHVTLDGSSGKATSVCGGNPIQVGDSADSVYSACGSPAETNQTFIEQPAPGKFKTDEWIYSMGDYQPSFHLTFINGILQSID